MKLKELIKRIKLPAKASIYYLAASAAGKIVSFVITPFTTRLLGKEEFGQFSLYMALLGGASVICSAMTSGSAVYKGLQKFNDRKKGYLKGVLWISLSLSIVICTFLFVLVPFVKLKAPLLIPLSLQIICDVTVAVAMSGERFDYKYKTVATVALAVAILPPTMAVFIIKTWGGGYVVRIYSMLFVSLCAAIYSLVKLFRFSGKEQVEIGYALHASLPLLPHSISTALSVQADKLIISSLLGAAALAKYSVVYSLGIALQFTVGAIGSALTPWIIRRLDTGEIKRISALVLPMTVGYCALSLFLITASPEAMMILAPRDYLDALPALLPIALSTPIYFLSTVTTVGLNYSEKGKYLVVISLTNMFINLSLNYMLIERFGFIGAGIASLISHSVSTLLGAILLRRVSLENMLSLGKLSRTLIGCAAVAVLIWRMRESISLRIAALLLPAIMRLYCVKKAGELVIEKG